MSALDPRGTVFRPKYRLVLWFGLAMSTLSSFLVAAAAVVFDAHWAIVAAFLVMPVSALGTLLWTLLYRSIEFGEDGLTLGRYLFPDLEMPYRAVDDVSSVGFRSKNRVVSWKVMRNGEELASRVGALREAGVIGDEQLSGEMEADTEANQLASAIVVGILCGVFGGLGAGTGIDVFRWEVILSAVLLTLVGTPALKSFIQRMRGAEKEPASRR